MTPKSAAIPPMRGLVVTMLLIGSVAVCRREATAQYVERDPLGPTRCFQFADAEQLSSERAIDLCAGALTDAPGRCFARANDLHPELSEQKVLALCSGATSNEPLDCYARLAAEEVLTEDQVVAYCATRCALGPPPPQVSNPECLASALDATNLALQTAGDLCVGASSAGPVQCFLAGQDLNKISDGTLVQLCAERLQCQYQYYNASAAPAY